MKKDPLFILNYIAQIVFDKKGINLLALDIKKVSTLADYVLIAEGNVDRHVIAIAQNIIEAMGKIGEKPSHVEGMQMGDWVVLDFWQVMVHLFMPGMRDKYQLEQLWKEGEIVDLNIVVNPEEQKSYMRR